MVDGNDPRILYRIDRHKHNVDFIEVGTGEQAGILDSEVMLISKIIAASHPDDLSDWEV